MNWSLFFVIVASSLPGLVIGIPAVIRTLENSLPAAADGRPLPDSLGKSPATLAVASIVQSLVLVAISAAVGTVLMPLTGFNAPVFEALIGGGNILPEILAVLPLSLAISIPGALVLIALYYLIYRPNDLPENIERVEKIRMQSGLLTRILYGGVVEEILSRWGMMSLFTWLFSLLVGSVTTAVIWLAIVAAGILFGLGHLPSYLAAGCRRTPLFLGVMIGLNLWASLLFGYLFWQHGLFAAILSHAVFHTVWYPFDAWFYQNRPVTAPNQ